MQRSKKGLWCSNNNNNVIKSFYMSDKTDAEAYSARLACEAYCLPHAQCNACSAHCPFNPLGGCTCQWNAIPDCGEEETAIWCPIQDISRKGAGEADFSPCKMWPLPEYNDAGACTARPPSPALTTTLLPPLPHNGDYRDRPTA